MWRCSLSQAYGQGPARTNSLLLRWRKQGVPHRWASSFSSSSSGRGHHGFRAGAVDPTPYQVKPNFNVPIWQPPACFMKYRAVRWLSNNLLALATYQLVLEVGFTVVFGSLLYAEIISAQSVCDWLERAHYPFVSWIELDDCVYTDPVKIGPFSLNPQKVTALHTGHNIANGLLPVQVMLMLVTFAPMHRMYRQLRHLPPVSGSAVAAAAASTPTTAASKASSRASGAVKTSTTHRRASYAVPTSKATWPRQPF